MPPREALPDPHRALQQVRDLSRNACEELLATFPLLPDRESARALDLFLDHLLDALRMLDAEATAVAAQTAHQRGSAADERGSEPGGRDAETGRSLREWARR